MVSKHNHHNHQQQLIQNHSGFIGCFNVFVVSRRRRSFLGGFPSCFYCYSGVVAFLIKKKMMIIMTVCLNACLSKLLILFPRFTAHQKVVLFMISFHCFLSGHGNPGEVYHRHYYYRRPSHRHHHYYYVQYQCIIIYFLQRYTDSWQYICMARFYSSTEIDRQIVQHNVRQLSS